MTAQILSASLGGPCFLPRSLADIVGHERVVGRIKYRFERDQHATPLLLYGPDGVGKRTTACMYAKALLCVSDRADHSMPCDECSACRSFGSDANIDYLKIDARVTGGKEKLREFLSAAPIGPRRVLIIDKIDQAAPEFLDALLKPMEREDDEVENDQIQLPIIIILAERLDGVRQAGQSRCDVERLWPLVGAAAEFLALRAVDSLEIKGVDDEAIRSLVVGSRGLPRLIVFALNAIRNESTVTAAGLRRVLGIDWADEVATHWLTLLAPARPERGIPVSGSDTTGEQLVARLRSVWSGLKTLMAKGRAGSFEEPALYYLDRSVMQRLEELLNERALHKNMTTVELWSDIAEVLLQEGFADECGQLLLARKIRALVAIG